ncbi:MULTISPECIES: biliverdin-producing heme oxygenase [unclassified Sphingomonas]|uniref:biliverdin-producing heme oxygenase n=1 Tax=unclassified Sphingomonas TaxID=196159 RepID=UPI002269CCE3|nr:MULTISPECIES: biliverdin-producing heme oxygenase [unclassified Sphingomonas]
MSFIKQLRAETAADHDRVDMLYGRFALDRAADYRNILIAHAAALPAVEAALGVADDLPAWRPRTALIAQDLAALGVAMPVPAAFAAPDDASRWGALYVIEGSRLGGTLLARSVPAGLPSAYLAASHQPGEWRALLAALEARAAVAGEAWRQRVLAGARACFGLYAAVVGREDRPDA